MNKIETVEQLNELLEQGPLLVLKHSTTCPISHAAYEEYEKYVSEEPELQTCLLIVQEARPLSTHIAETFHVKHESPQAVLFVNKDVTWHASHWKITYKSLVEAIKENIA